MFHVIYTKTDSSVCIYDYVCMYACMRNVALYIPCGTLGACVHVVSGDAVYNFTYNIYYHNVHFCAHTHKKNKALISRQFAGLVYLPPR